MAPENIIEATGAIVKEEDLINIKHKVMPNTLVLESSHPFPGYHGSNLPENPLPGIIYLVTRTKYAGEDILRAAKKIKKSFPDNFEASFGQAEKHEKIYHFIRVKNLDCFDCIPVLQNAFTGEGIQFMKRKSVSGEALIKLQKFFRLQRMEKHLYKDLDDPLMYYFEIPEKPGWELFKKITIYIRANVDNYTFDAALGTLYLEDILDMVRIYAKDLTWEQLEFIRKKYLYELSHPDHLD